ncbi:MAG: hypothetical protein J4431_02005 [Candidatus Aenigmarchaeota archaeon]|nr:hypothetical protein [Candidatus Aenigmarchaeota archaeon]
MTFRPFFALILAVVLIISLSYPVMAQGADDRSARPVAERIKNLHNEKLDALDEKAKEGLNSLNERALDKVQNLEKRSIEKIAALEKQAARKITSVSKERLDAVSNLDEERLNKLAKLGDARIKEFSQMNEETLREKIDSITVSAVPKERILKARIVPAGSAAGAAERFGIAKQLLASARDRVGERAAELRAIKSQVAACRESNGAECKEVMQKSFDSAKIIVTGSADKGIEALKKAKARIEGSETMDAAGAEAAIAGIDAAIASLESAKSQAESAETAAQLKEAAGAVKSSWRIAEDILKLHIAKAAHAGTGFTIKRLSHAENRLERILAYADGQGIDTSGLDAKVSEFSAAVEKARAKAEESGKKIAEARDAREATLTDGNVTDEEKAALKKLIDESSAMLKEANAAAKEAHAILAEIAKTIMESYKEIKVTESQIVNAEDELPEEIGEPEAVEITG